MDSMRNRAHNLILYTGHLYYIQRTTTWKAKALAHCRATPFPQPGGPRQCEFSVPTKEKGELMNVTVGILPQCTKASNDHDAHFTHITISFVNYLH